MNVIRYEDAQNGRSWVALMAPAIELAKAIAGTDFVPVAYRGKPAEIAAAIMYGDEVGLGPLQSLAKISIINGRPTLAAETLRGLILAAGHEIWIEEATTTRVTVGGRRKDSDRSQLFTWTLDDAKRAGIAGKQPWRQYPRQMLLARASAELARAVFADVIGGLAATEELEGLEDADTGNAPEPAPQSAPAPGTTRRRRRPVIAPSPPAPADTAEAPPLPDEEEPPKLSDAQSRKLHALFRERGLTDRDDRLDWANQHLDHTIVSSAELTDTEASTLIDLLEQEIAAFDALAPEQAPPDDTQHESPTTPAAPAETASRGARGPAAPTQTTITRDSAEILRHMEREAGMTPTPMNELLKLTPEQAHHLQTQINAAMDERLSDE